MVEDLRGRDDPFSQRLLIALDVIAAGRLQSKRPAVDPMRKIAMEI